MMSCRTFAGSSLLPTPLSQSSVIALPILDRAVRVATEAGTAFQYGAPLSSAKGESL